MEIGSDTSGGDAVSTILNRDAGDVNMTVTGTYTERPKAAYCCATKPDTYAQSVLNNPFSGKLHLGTSNVVASVNIADASQITRSSENVTSQIYVGPYNTTA